VLSLEGIKGKKFSEPLVFHDPVDGNRKRRLGDVRPKPGHLHLRCPPISRGTVRTVLLPPPEGAAELPVMREMLARRGNGVLVVTIERPCIIDDNLYPQVRRSLDGICALLEGHDFRVIDRAFHVAEALSFVVEVESLELPLGKHHSGPPAWVDNSYAFLESGRRKD
jgi:tRNA nucleotidyltransferase (CCA-adding enzyme)